MTLPPQPKGLVFDLEVVPAKNGKADRIIMIGGLRPDTGGELELKVGSDAADAVRQLDALSHGASFVLGHNVVEHDLPLLQTAAPDLAMLRLPVIDTLRLSPLAFPQNPYHRLVKDYKLIRDSLNSPLADCRSTLTLFLDQREAFGQLRSTHRDELLCYQSLLAPSISGGDLGAFFGSLTGATPISLPKALKLVPNLLIETDPTLDRDLKVCRPALATLLDHVEAEEHLRWSFAYALAWLRVSGGNSVLAPWVRYQFPAVVGMIQQLRDEPCGSADCQYCRTTHDPRLELKRYFGFDDFRYESPGSSLQHDVVLAGMQGENVLAVLATGGGKSLCYQLPALNRFHRNGSLTIIVSPLQSLMKDQVDGLLSRNVQCAAALNGLLTMPERADVLEKIQLGDIGILLVSPEQFRNMTFRKAIAQRQIGAWIFDEAHCLSKWGNDFRPDYLYAARFIREFSGDQPVAPIGCFTATAKPDVLGDIEAHFQEMLGLTFKSFIGTHERTNLSFEVLPCLRNEKWARINQLLSTELGEQDGGAVIFVASRRKTEELASFLISQNWSCRHFHAGLEPHEKKDIQESFISGSLRIIVATNAFGMGVDKPDIRLVVHADIPGSLENYLQEAGRAGRDQAQARCVLLYDPEDIETQFGLSERSKLSLRDIQQILRKLRVESTKRKGGELVITAGEILLDDNVDTSFDIDDQDAETKVVTAVAWLERGEYLKREVNKTQIFPARPGLSKEECDKRLKQANLSQRRRQEFEAILRFLYSAGPDQRINTDQLMALTGQTQEEVAGALKQLEELGLLVNDAQLTLYLRHGTSDSATQLLEQSLQLEKALFDVLREQAPDADSGAWQDLNLQPLTAELKERTNRPDLLPLHVQRLLRSLAQDRDGESRQRSSFELRQISRDYLKLRVQVGHDWKKLEAQGAKRRAIASKVLSFLVDKIAPGVRGKDLLVETTFSELLAVIEQDLALRHEIRLEQRRKAIEHVLLYMHLQEVLTLNHGMTVMRRAMTIDINPEKRGAYRKEDYLRLDEHYRERGIQVHVMREYAEMGLKGMATALGLVLDYFSQGKREFIMRYFAGRERTLKLMTSEASWRTIVHSLSGAQKQAVTDDDDRNCLLLAGPGSGKTRVIVHRIAYLLRVRRVPASCVVALTFNRHAANEIRKRLFALIGQEAYGLTVLTYHSMAMRLTGTRFERGAEVNEAELKSVLENAVELLEGKGHAEGDDDLREQLMRGYRYILVDEYQDIDEMQYRLVSALAGRTTDDEGKLCIMAVGDDDQNIYGWRQTSNQYIERFTQEYEASISYLIENFRSTGHIINAANRVIQANPDRLKAEHPIGIDKKRVTAPAGGNWEELDPIRRGRVLRIQLPATDRDAGNLQAQAAARELVRLTILEGLDVRGCAVLARSHRYLAPLQAWCEQNGVPYHLAANKDSALPLTRLREFVKFVRMIGAHEEALTPADLLQLVEAREFSTQWRAFFTTAVEQMQVELGDSKFSAATLVDWLYEYAREIRQQTSEGLYLGTVHSAKGLEFRHVVLLDGSWKVTADQLSDERRLYYVGMTRAEQSLTICEYPGGNPFSHALADSAMVENFTGTHDPQLEVQYRQLTLRDVDIGYAGRHSESDSIHKALAELSIGREVELRPEGGRYLIVTEEGWIVGRTARSFKLDALPRKCEVMGMVVRYAADGEEQFRKRMQVEQWEVPVVRVAFVG